MRVCRESRKERGKEGKGRKEKERDSEPSHSKLDRSPERERDSHKVTQQGRNQVTGYCSLSTQNPPSAWSPVFHTHTRTACTGPELGPGEIRWPAAGQGPDNANPDSQLSVP